MNRKLLLTIVVMLCVTLVTACVSTRFFMSFETVETEKPDPSQGQEIVNSMANQDMSAVESQVREAWSLADAAAEERASNAAAQQQASNVLNPTQPSETPATDPSVTETPATDAEGNTVATDTTVKNPVVSGGVPGQDELDAVGADGTSLKTLYSDACIVGDSSIAAISLYGLLDEPYCLGEVGASLYFLEEQLDTIISLQPKHLILHFGANMLNSSTDYMNNSFIGFYVDLCQQLEASIPGVQIVISSLLPMTAEAEASNAVYAYRTAYNDALREMCATYGWLYLDNEEFALSHMDLIEPDGMHFQYSFYKEYWLKFIYLKAGIGA